ncbi:MAG: DUF362 domain-containing protein [Armatimonadota bacterium]|nr:MAG: DUF362 domain-containing protein [Armatimonadota bacterium]
MNKGYASTPAAVAIARADRGDNDSIRRAVREAASAACDLREVIPAGARVVLKPNIFAPYPPPTTTDPRVVVATAELAREAGAGEIVVAEGRSISTARFRSAHNTTRACAQVTGMAAALEAAGLEFIALEDDEFVEVEVPGADLLHRASVPRTILEADVLISVPVMKVHSLTLVTMGVKNLHGIVSDFDKACSHRYRDYHLPRKLVDLLLIKRPALTVLDALLGQEADHATSGNPVAMGLIVASTDPVALDAVASDIMGFDPLEIDTTRIAAERGLGVADAGRLRVIGPAPGEVRREFARPDLELSPKKFPGLTVCAGDYCRACEYYTRRGLEGLARAGKLSPEQPLTLVIGKDVEVPDDLPGRVVLVGDCALESPSVKRLRNRLIVEGRLAAVYACPPMELRIRAEELLS